MVGCRCCGNFLAFQEAAGEYGDVLETIVFDAGDRFSFTRAGSRRRFYAWRLSGKMPRL